MKETQRMHTGEQMMRVAVLNIVENLCELMDLSASVAYTDNIFTITIKGKALNK